MSIDDGRAVQRRGGTTTDHASFAGLERELTVDTTKKTVVVHDGFTAGGYPLAHEGAIPEGAVASDDIVNIVTLTQAEYDALPDKEASTMYVIVIPFLAAGTGYFELFGQNMDASPV